MSLNPRQARFVSEYLVDLNASAAAIRAGYSPQSARSQAADLLTNPNIAAAIAEAQAARGRRTEVTADRVVLELARVAFGDPRRVMSWGPGGVRLRPSAELADEEAAIVAEVGETTTKEGGSLRVKTVDKLGALRLLGQHLGMFGDGKVARDPGDRRPSWAGLQAVLLRVLDRHPDAKRAVVAALEADGGGGRRRPCVTSLARSSTRSTRSSSLATGWGSSPTSGKAGCCGRAPGGRW